MAAPHEVVEMLPAAPHAPGPLQPEPGPSPDARSQDVHPAAAPRAAFRSCAPLVAVLALAVYPLPAHLDQRVLWEDEGETAVFARAIVASRLRLAWDGRTPSDGDSGAGSRSSAGSS